MKMFITTLILLTGFAATSLRAQEFDSRRLGIYATAFFTGQYSEEDAANENGNVKGSSQKSLSLGATSTYRLAKEQQLLWNVFWSHYLKTDVTFSGGQTDKLSYPNEYGTSFHYRYALPFWKSSFAYGGAEYESLSFLNLNDYISGSSALGFNRYNIIFATVGVGYTFLVDEKIINVKGQISQSVISSTNAKNDISAKGQKYHLMGSIRPGAESKFFYNTFVSRYQLKRDTSGSLTRIGLGVNYLFQ